MGILDGNNCTLQSTMSPPAEELRRNSCKDDTACHHGIVGVERTYHFNLITILFCRFMLDQLQIYKD